ncbi:MAG: ATP-binding protein, partial [Planctomycetota bacterium]
MSARQMNLFPHLRVSPSILARLGEELNPNPDHGLLELVKNAYDADARRCSIELIDTNEPGGEVRISDDGDGMDEAQIVDDWLILGSSRKSIDKPTRLGRLPVGSKGLGRLAALRLGTTCCLTTRPRRQRSAEYRLDIDWQKFENARTVEEVELDIQRTRRVARKSAGTEIRLSGLRTRVARMDVTRLARGILLLADPFKDSPTGFNPQLKAPEFKDLEALVRKRYFDDAEFHLVAELDDQGRAKAAVKDYRGQTLFEGGHVDLCGKAAEPLYECPAARFDLWAFILDKKTFGSRSTTVGEVQQWLGHFGGVHLYVRDVRVAPYGDPGH